MIGARDIMNQKPKMLLYNDALTTISRIISSIERGRNRKSYLMYELQTNNTRLTLFINLMLEHQLITETEIITDIKKYHITEKGKRFSELINSARGMLSYT